MSILRTIYRAKLRYCVTLASDFLSTPLTSYLRWKLDSINGCAVPTSRRASCALGTRGWGGQGANVSSGLLDV
jgi:hypothetical protein